MADDLRQSLSEIARRAPAGWLLELVRVLRSVPAGFQPDAVKRRLPPTSNADLALLVRATVDSALGQLSWEALGYGLQVASEVHAEEQQSHKLELLWSGPEPAANLPARRIDQALYDLITNAQSHVLLVTFAAAKVARLAAVLSDAVSRGVEVRLIFEFAESSEGQLSFDALNAFPNALIDAVEVYHWPLENRARNQAGRPGKLHAKVGVVDQMLLMSSANLTDDAFNRNLEMGLLAKDEVMANRTREHFEGLIKTGVLRLFGS